MTTVTASGHGALQESLAQHLRARPDKPTVVTEVALSGAWGSAGRVDVAAISWGSSWRCEVQVYEVKTSISDFRRDVDAGKWTKYLEVADRVMFAAPAGVIPKAEVPKECGLVVLGEGASWRQVTRAPRLTPAQGDAARMGAVLRMLRRLGDDTRVLHQQLDDEARRDRMARYADYSDDDLVTMLSIRFRDVVLGLKQRERGIEYREELARTHEQETRARVAAIAAQADIAPVAVRAASVVLQRLSRAMSKAGGDPRLQRYSLDEPGLEALIGLAERLAPYDEIRPEGPLFHRQQQRSGDLVVFA